MFFPLIPMCKHVNDVADILKKNELRWLERLLTWVQTARRFGGFDIDDYFHYLSGLRLASYNAEVCFIVKFLKETDVFISEFRIRSWKELKKPNISSKSPGIPLNSQIIKLLKNLSIQEQLHVLIMTCSGRRFIDVSRIDSKFLKSLDDKFICKIARTKTSSQPVLFSFEFKDADLLVDWEFYRSEFLKIIRSEELPFESTSMQKIRRVADYTIHATRHRKALSLIRNGSTIQETLNFIGWSSASSFKRYTKIPVADIKEFSSLDETIIFINSYNF